MRSIYQLHTAASDSVISMIYLLLHYAVLLLMLKECEAQDYNFVEADSKFLGDTYPICVDVLSIDPPPYSNIKTVNGRFSFAVTFSRAVKKRNVYDENKRWIPDSYVTPSLIELQEITPIDSYFMGSSRTKRKYIFSITQDELRIYKSVDYFLFNIIDK